MSILLYGCTTWTLTRRMEKNLDGNNTRMNKYRKQHPKKQQMYGHLLPITKTTQFRRTRHAWHSWRSRDKLISDTLLWTRSHGRAKEGWRARTYIQQLCAEKGCKLEDLPGGMNPKDGWWEIRLGSATWWPLRFLLMWLLLFLLSSLLFTH